MSNKYDMTCSCCGAKLDLDLDNLQVYCPYCGNKLMIDMAQLNQILIEREKTKRYQMKYDHDIKVKEMDYKESTTVFKGLIFIVLICFVLLFFLFFFV